MQIELPSDVTQFIESLVASGKYSSADEALTDGVRLLMTRQKLHQDIQAGIEDLEAGRSVDGKQAFAEIRQRLGLIRNQD